jgi:hypothetical protein
LAALVLVLAAGVAVGGISPEVSARGSDSLDERRGEQVRVIDPVAEVTRLMESQMGGWGKDCSLARPKKSLSSDEQRIYDRASELLYTKIIPFLAEYENALDLHTAYRESSPERRRETQEAIEGVIPALQQFLRYRRDNPSVVCMMRNQRRY